MTVRHIAEAEFPTRFGKFKIHAYKDGSNRNHIALVRCNGGDSKEEVPVRIHSKCLTGDTFCSLRCDCREQLESALSYLGKKGCGILIYLDQEGRGIGLANKIKAYALQDEGLDTVEANKRLGFKEDLRHYSVAAEILKKLKVKSIRLITNNPNKIEEMEKNGIKVVCRIPLVVKPTEYTKKYLRTKKEKMHHLLE
jgi:GTP cyclohydrolase II